MEKIEEKAEYNYPEHLCPDDYNYPNTAVTSMQRRAFINGYTTRNDEVVKMVQDKIKECEELEFLMTASVLTDLLTKLTK